MGNYFGQNCTRWRADTKCDIVLTVYCNVMAEWPWRYTFFLAMLVIICVKWYATICKISNTWTGRQTDRVNQYTPLTASHYSDVITSAMASQITHVSIVYSTVCAGADQRKHQKIHVTGLCEGNSPVTGEFPTHEFWSNLCWTSLRKDKWLKDRAHLSTFKIFIFEKFSCFIVLVVFLVIVQSSELVSVWFYEKMTFFPNFLVTTSLRYMWAGLPWGCRPLAG